jgi:hypothetical protein
MMSDILGLTTAAVVVVIIMSAAAADPRPQTITSQHPNHCAPDFVDVQMDASIKQLKSICELDDSFPREQQYIGLEWGGVVTSNLCPGSSDTKCCTQPQCFTPSGTGTCMQTSLCASKDGNSLGGYCNGPGDLQCCVTGVSSIATYGVDVSTTITTSAASCFKSSGISYVVPRGYMSIGAVDTQVCTSLSNAQSAGITTRDVYLFPCPTCSKSAASQMSELASYLKSNCASAWSGRVWLDIEGTQYWTGSTSNNQAWYMQLKDSCSTLGVRCVVYSSYYQWQGIFGTTSFSYGSELPLWYAQYDNSASFSDFSAFGGWSKPHAKQYQGDVTLCSMGVDRNYASGSF